MQELRFDALSLVDEERNRQVEKWGTQRLSWVEWASVLGEEFGEFAQQANEVHFDPTGCLDKEGLLVEATQVAAVAVAIIEHLLGGNPPPTPQMADGVRDSTTNAKSLTSFIYRTPWSAGTTRWTQ